MLNPFAAALRIRVIEAELRAEIAVDYERESAKLRRFLQDAFPVSGGGADDGEALDASRSRWTTPDSTSAVGSTIGVGPDAPTHRAGVA